MLVIETLCPMVSRHSMMSMEMAQNSYAYTMKPPTVEVEAWLEALERAYQGAMSGR